MFEEKAPKPLTSEEIEAIEKSRSLSDEELSKKEESSVEDFDRYFIWNLSRLHKIAKSPEDYLASRLKGEHREEVLEEKLGRVQEAEKKLSESERQYENILVQVTELFLLKGVDIEDYYVRKTLGRIQLAIKELMKIEKAVIKKEGEEVTRFHEITEVARERWECDRIMEFEDEFEDPRKPIDFKRYKDSEELRSRHRYTDSERLKNIERLF